MKIKRTPQDKKRLSYKKDCRNVYGENDKSSRKAIHQRKRWVNQSYQRILHQTITEKMQLLEENLETFDHDVLAVRRKHWKRSPDKPLGAYLKRKGKFIRY